ncbi:MBL fold metallo-hydrolase [Candidatus Bathyarchaeota archaeon]|nr:MBL fold metallo-hydrolase [Candidatus Bathyarchaeota archaeon]
MVKNEVVLTFYGGVDEIGGNKILLKDGDTAVFLDFGMSFALRKQFFSPPLLSPKSEKSLQELGILPKLEGVYRFDEKPPAVDAIFISHGHMDHSAYLSFVKREIPVYCGETTKIILQAFGEIRRADLEFNVEGINFQTFRTGNIVKVGGLEIEPVHVDHSVPGAYGFIIHTSKGAVVYTGDFRDHGAKDEMTREFVERVKAAEPVALVCEATNMTNVHVSSEKEVEAKLNQVVSQTEGLVLAEFAYTDVDRLNSFYKTALKNNRCLAVSLRQAYLIEALASDRKLRIPRLSDEGMMIFRKSKERMYAWERQILERYPEKVVDVEQVSKRQQNMILTMSLYDLEQLVEIQPQPGSCYIFSSSEPFNEEMEIDFERLVNWLRHYGLPQYHVHVSGHITPLRLKACLKEINAEKVFPVHTENAGLFAKFMRDLKSQIAVTEKGKEYRL